MIEVDWLMMNAVKRNQIFWGNLTAEESSEYMYILNLRRQWYDAWNCVERSHRTLGIPYEGPTAFLPNHILLRCEELQRKGWGCVPLDEETKKCIRAANRLAALQEQTKV